jgi:site-specific DNA-cytosine methylase
MKSILFSVSRSGRRRGQPPMTLTIGSLFSGIGGFDLAGEAMGWRTAWFVEWDASCRFWLAEHFPGRPIYGDITQVDFTEVEAVDILCGGFPCQPASAAGKRLGTADDRWLWPQFARAIREIRPRYVVAENVPGLLSVNGGRAFAEVLRDLAALGYDAEWSGLSAADVGAPHSRERAWIVAYPCIGAGARVAGVLGADARVEGNERDEPEHRSGQLVDAASGGRRARQGIGVRRTSGRCESVGYSDRGRLSERAQLNGGASQDPANGNPCGRYAHRPTLEIRPWADAVAERGADGTVRLIPRQAAFEGPESSLWPVADGFPGRVARLRAIGNSVVPQCVIEGPFQVIQELESLESVSARLPTAEPHP